MIDATNDMSRSPFDHLDAFARLAPDAAVYRAFNTLGWENFAEPDHDGVAASLFYCGPDDAIESLVRDVGLEPVLVGGLDHADLLDALTRLWFTLAVQQGRGRRTAFKVLPG